MPLTREEAQKKYDFTIQNIRDAIAFKKPEKVPVVANTFNWQFLDAGMSVGKAVRDYGMIEQAARRFAEQYKVDQFGAGLRNPFRVTDTLGKRDVYSANGNDDNMNAICEDAILPEDYDEIIDGRLNKVLWEKALPRLYPDVKDYTPQMLAEAAKEQMFYQQAAVKCGAMLKDEYGLTGINSKTWVNPFFEDLFKFYRGIKGLAIDVRRCPQKVEDACDAVMEPVIAYTLSVLNDGTKGPQYPYTSECYSSLLGHTILSRKNFDRFYVKYLDPLVKACEANGQTYSFFSEGDLARVLDYFNDFKKGTVSVMIETEDPYEIRKQFPNICIYGGLDTDVLGQGTVQECIDMAKRAIDVLGAEGGLVLEPSKMVSYSYDMKSENFKAVCDFVDEYR